MQPLSDLSNTLRRAIKKRQRRLSRKKQTRSLLSETLEDRRLLAAQPLEHHGEKGQVDRPAAEPTVFEREKPPAVDLTELTRGKSSAWQKASASVFGRDTGAKDGALRKVGTQLAFLFHEFDEHNEREKNDKRFPNPLKEFTPTDRIIKIHDQVDNEKVIVDIVTHGDPNAVKEDLVKLGVDVTGVYGKIVSGWAPIETIDQLADHRNIRSVRPFLAETASGNTTSQGDAAQLSDDLRASKGVDGFGVTVGVLSDSYDNNDSVTTAADDIASGDLPADVNVLSDMASGGSDEGRAMLQIIHDVAPGADLAFATATQGQAAFAQSIRDLHQTAGADVIVDDVLYYAEPFFQDGIVSQAIDEVNAAGVAYFVAAGNNANHSYEQEFRGGATHDPTAFSSVQDAPLFAGGQAHDFDPDSGVTDEMQGFTLGDEQSITLSFQWNQPFASVTGSVGASTDMDIYVLNDSDHIVAASMDSNIGADPVEILHFTNDTGTSQDYSLMFVKYAGDDPDMVKYIEFKSSSSTGMTGIEFNTSSSTIYGHANAIGAATVGATYWNETPEFQSSTPTVQSFSSVGGTTVYLDPYGSQYPSPEPRDKPDFTAPDGGNTTFFGTDVAEDTDFLPNFGGTSASAAHAAGVAALLLEAVDGAEPHELYASMRGTATAIPVDSTIAGQGLLNASAAEPNLQNASDGAMASLDATTFSGAATISTTAKTLNTYIGDDQTPVDTGDTYRITGWAKSGDPYVVANIQTLGFSSYDALGREIEAKHIRTYAASHTTLANPLDNGETTVHLTSSNGWKDDGAHYQRIFAWYPWESYPDYGYTRNLIEGPAGAWGVSDVDTTLHTLELEAPWPHSTLGQGTKVANALSGENFNYWPLEWDPIGNSGWQEISETITGESDTDEKQFRTSTEFISPHLLTNYHSSSLGPNEINWRNIRVTREGRFKAGDKVDLHVNSIDYDPADGYTYQWNQVSGPLVSLENPTAAIATIDKLKDSLIDYSLGFEVLITLGSNPPTKEVVTVHVEAGDTQVDPVEDYLDATTYFDENFGETITTNQRRVDMFGDTLIPIDPSLTYKLSGEVKASATEYQAGNSQYFGFASFDDQGREIKARNVRLVSNSAHTVLDDDLLTGTRTIKLKNATGWAGSGSGGYQRNLAWYPDGDSEAYVYTPEVEYSSSGLWDGADIDHTTGIITLKNDWPGPDLDAGTKVGNAEGGSNFHYLVLNGAEISNTDFETKAQTVTGTSATSHFGFKPHTAYIKPAIITNNHGSGNNEITWRNIRFEHHTLSTYRVGDTVDLQVDEVQFPGAEITYHWTQTSGPPVPLGNANAKSAHISKLPDRLRDYTVDFQVDISDGITTITKDVSIDVDEPDGHEAALGTASASPSTAGNGQTVTLSTGNILSTFDGPLTYEWQQLTGPTVTLTDADKPSATFVMPNLSTDELTFQVTVSDGSLEVVQDVVVDVTASAADATFTLKTVSKRGNEITSISAGDTFILEVYAEDTRSGAKGVFSGYLDVLFDQDLVTVLKAPEFGTDYPWAQDFDIDTPGLINDTGAATGSTTYLGTGEKLLFSALLRAESPGTVTFRADPSDDLPTHEVTVYGQDNAVSETNISYDTASLQILDSITPYGLAGVCGSLQVNVSDPSINESGGTTQSTVTVSSTQECTAYVQIGHTGSDAFSLSNITEAELLNLHLDNGESKQFTVSSALDDDYSDETIRISAIAKGAGHFQTEGFPNIPDESDGKTISIVDADSGSTVCRPEIALSAGGERDHTENHTPPISFATHGNCSGDLDIWWDLSGPGADTYGPPPSDLEVLNGTSVLADDTVHPFSTPPLLSLQIYPDTLVESSGSIKFFAEINNITAEHTVHIHDACQYTFTPSSATINESDAQPYLDTAITITATGSAAVCGNVVDVSWDDDGGDGAQDADYDVLSAGLTPIASGLGVTLIEESSNVRKGTINLRLYPDSIPEASSSVTFTAGGAHLTVDIDDDDGSAGNLELITTTTNAREADSHFYCGNATPGEIRIQLSQGSWPTPAELPEIVLVPTGTAVYGEDYTVVPSIGGPVSYSDGYIRVTNPVSAVSINLDIVPVADLDETEGTETISFQLLSSAASSTPAAVNLIDDPEGITIVAVDDTATESNSGIAQVKIEPEHSGEQLCADVRLLIDTNGASSADAPDVTTDYTLREGSTVLEAHPYEGSPGLYRVADGPVAFSVSNQSNIVIDLTPADDGVLEGTEYVYAKAEAKDGDDDWVRSANFVTLTIEDHTLDAISDAEIFIDLEPDNECIVCTTGGIHVDLQSGSPTVPIVSGFLDFLGQGTHGTQPVVRGQFARPADLTWPDEIEVQVKVDDWDDNNGDKLTSLSDPLKFTLDTTGYQEDSIAFAVPLDLEDLATGSYRFELIGDEVGAGTDHWEVKTSHFVINRWDSNDVAPGLSFPFLKELIPDAKKLVKGASGPVRQDGVAIVRGDNSVSFYNFNGVDYDLPPESVTTLATDSNYYILTDRFGNVDRFRKTAVGNYQIGDHYSHTDSNGNETIFTYDSLGRLETVKNPLNRTTTLYYTNPTGIDRLTITDFAGRDIVVDYTTSTRDLDVTYPNPSSGPQPKDTFKFDTQHWITEITRHADSKGSVNQTTTFTYDDHDFGYTALWGRLETITWPDATTLTLDNYRQHEGLPANDREWVVSSLPALEMDFPNDAKVLDGKGNASTSVLDHRGRVLSFTDRHGQTFTYDRELTEDTHGNYMKDRGDVKKSTTPDPDDFTGRTDVPLALQSLNDSLGPQVTHFTYDDRDVTEQILPDLGAGKEFKRLWSNFTLGRPGNHTNELGQTGTTMLDAAGNADFGRQEVPDAAPNRTEQGLTNPQGNLDVDGDGTADQADLDKVIDDVNENGIGNPSPDREPDAGHTDTNGDGVIAPGDAVLIVNEINGETGTAGNTVDQSYDAPAEQRIDYEYTDSTGDLPDGLVTKKTVTTGRASTLVTNYEYYDTLDEKHGLLKEVTYAVGATEEAEVKYFYDSNGNLEKIVDELNRETHFVYDVLDRLVSVTSEDPDTQVNAGEEPLITTYTYDAFGNVASVTVENHNEFAQPAVTTTHTTCYYYDKMDRIQWEVAPDPSSNTVAATCNDTEDMPADHADATNNKWTGRPVTFYEKYDQNGNLEKVTDPEGRVTEFAYDKLDRLNKITEPEVDPAKSYLWTTGEVTVPGTEINTVRPITNFVYDNLGNVWSVTDSLGNTIEYRYDAWNRPIKLIRPDPHGGSTATETTYEYFDTEYGWVKHATDPEGRTTESQGDHLGRTTYILQPADAEGVRPLTWFEYFDDSLAKIVVDPEGNETEYSYDGRARLIQTDQPHGVTSQFAYDAANQLTSVTDGLSRTTTYSYDKLGRVSKIEPPDPDDAPSGEESPTVEYFYDSAGNMVSSKDALTFETKYEYDHLFRKAKGIDENGHITTYVYDLVNNLEALTDPEDNKTEWKYDNLNRPYEEKDAKGNTRKYLYDVVGNLRRSTDANGRVIDYGYDDLYRLKTEAWNDDRTFEFSYDLVNNLLSAKDSTNGNVHSAYTFEYDDLNRVIFETQQIEGLTESVVFAPDYDLIGNRTSQSANLGGSVVEGILQGGASDFATTYDYDGVYRLTSVTQQGAGGNVVAPKHVAFTYDVASQTTNVKRYADKADTITELVAHSLYEYDKVGRLTGITHSREVSAAWNGTFDSDPAAHQTQLAAYIFDYDEGNRLTSMDSWRDELTINYTYDPRDQLTGASFVDATTNAPFVPTSSESYTYDDNGNRVTANGQTYEMDSTTNHDNRMKSDGVYDYLYDEEGNRTKKTNPADNSYTTYAWDHRNRLVSVTDHDDEANVLQKVTYTYDAFDRRIGKQVDTDGNGSADSATYFVHDGAHITLQFEDADGDGTLTPELSNRYLHGPIIDMILADEQVTEDWQEGEVYWPLTDHLGSVRDVVDSGGEVQNHILYDAFGNKLDEGGATNESVDFLFAYTGRDWDDDVDLQYNRARWYDSAVGRWLSEDPISFAAGDANLYRYVGNASSTYSDPTGLEGVKITIPSIELPVWLHSAIWDTHRPSEQDGRVRAGEILAGNYTDYVPAIVAVRLYHEMMSESQRPIPRYVPPGTMGPSLIINPNVDLVHEEFENGNPDFTTTYADEAMATYESVTAVVTSVGAAPTSLRSVPGRSLRTLRSYGARGEPVLFGQRRIGPVFSTSDNPATSRRLFTDVVADLKSGFLHTDDLPITAFRDPDSGVLVSMNTRTRAAIADAGLEPTNVEIVDIMSMSEKIRQKYLGRLVEDTLISSPLPGRRVPMTPRRSDPTIMNRTDGSPFIVVISE